jgi:drug/metabolite transporter (DMT)-like permease
LDDFVASKLYLNLSDRTSNDVADYSFVRALGSEAAPQLCAARRTLSAFNVLQLMSAAQPLSNQEDIEPSSESRHALENEEHGLQIYPASITSAETSPIDHERPRLQTPALLSNLEPIPHKSNAADLLRPPSRLRRTSSSTAAVFDVASSSSTAYIALPPIEPETVDIPSRNVLTSFVHRNLGLFLIASAQLFFATMNLCAKLLSQSDPPIHPLEIIFVRMTITWFGSLAYLHHKKIPGTPFGPHGVRLLLIARGGFGFFVLFGIYYSLQYLALSDATVLQFLAPILTGYFGKIFLNEVFLKTELYAGIISFIGVVLIAHPQSLFGGTSISGATPLQRLSAVGSSIMGAIGAAAAYITIRAIGARAHPLISVSLFALYSSLVAGAGLLILNEPFAVPRTVSGWLEWIVVGLSGFVGQFLLTSGLQIERAGRGVSMVYLQMFFAFAFEQYLPCPVVFFHFGRC